MTTPTKLLAVPAMLAALSLSATPAFAVELPIIASDAPAHVSPAISSYHGGWGWGRHHRYRHRGRTSAGDVLAGVLILGTIAAVANAASRAERARSYPYPNRYPEPYRDWRRDPRPNGLRGVEGAADLCLREIERHARVEEVARVERSASGWLVTGDMADGASFTCSIGADGRIDRIEIGGRAQGLDDYQARSEDDAPLRDYPSGVTREQDEATADYPGGPLPGDPVDEVAGGDPTS